MYDTWHSVEYISNEEAELILIDFKIIVLFNTIIMIYLQICTFTFSPFSFFIDGPYLRKALESDRELMGDLTSFHSARKAFTSNILGF